MSSQNKDSQPHVIMTRHRSQELQAQPTRPQSKKKIAIERGKRLNEILREKRERGEVKRSANPARSKSKRAGIHFPVTKFIKKFKSSNSRMSVPVNSGVMITSVVEYLTAEVLELSGYVTHEKKKKTISPRDIFLAVKNDSELNQLLKNTVMTQSGAVPHINPVLLVKSKRTKRKAKKIEPHSTDDQVELSQELEQMVVQAESTPKKNRVLGDITNLTKNSSTDDNFSNQTNRTSKRLKID